MRTKLIPAEILEPIKKNPAIFAGGAAVLLAGYFYLHHQTAASVAQPDTTGAGPLSTGSPIVYSQALPASVGSSAGGAVVGSATVDPTVAAALAVSAQKNTNDFTLGMASLQAQSDALATQANLALATNLTNREGIAASIAQTFLGNLSGLQRGGNSMWNAAAFNGSITDSMGQTINLNFSNSLIDPGIDEAPRAVGIIQQFNANNAAYIKSTQTAPTVARAPVSAPAGNASQVNATMPPSLAAVASSVAYSGTGGGSYSSLSRMVSV